MAVYMARKGVDGPVKIGWSEQVIMRMRQLKQKERSPITLLRLLNGDRELEKWYHRRFADYRLSGEWFTYDKKMLWVKPLFIHCDEIAPKAPRGPKEDIHLYLPIELADRVRAQARAEQRSMTNMTTVLVERALESGAAPSISMDPS